MSSSNTGPRNGRVTRFLHQSGNRILFVTSTHDIVVELNTSITVQYNADLMTKLNSISGIVTNITPSKITINDLVLCIGLIYIIEI
jgi:hypothetical protein